MSEQQPTQPEQSMKLPQPTFPELGLPPSPEVPHKDAPVHPDCEGQIHTADFGVNPMVQDPPHGVARILIGIPMLDIKYEFFESFIKLWTELVASGEKRYEVAYHVAYRKPVHMAEEYLVGIAKHNKCTHLLLMDDDIYDVTKKQIDLLFEADKDVIGGVMYASKFPHAMCVFRRFMTERKVIDMPSDNSIYRLYEVPCQCTKCSTPLTHWDIKHCPACGEPQSQLVQQADLIPFALTLIKMSVFDKLKEPYFHCTNKYPTDSWFADRLIEAGMTEHAHMGVRLNHAGITDETRPYYMQMGMARAQKARAVVNITPEQMETHQYLLHHKMQEVESQQKARPPFVSQGKPVANTDNINDSKELTLMTHGH